MKDRSRRVWFALLDSFWFLPALTAGTLALLAIVLVAVDRRSGTDGLTIAYQGGPAAARDVLAVLASSTITVAGLTFSIMIITLQLVAAQYTPRALRTFRSDRMTQLVAGTFVGVFAYALLVLRTIRGGSGVGGATDFVPSLSITVAILLGLVALVLLIAFVNHMSSSIQTSEIAARIAGESSRRLERIYPDGEGEATEDRADSLIASWHADSAPGAVRARRWGFVQAVALGPLVSVASRNRWQLHVIAKPGDFVTGTTTLLEVWPGEAARSPELEKAAHAAFTLGHERDLRQDALFGLRQLADITLRALSPGVNDPTTAVTCLRNSQELLERLAVAVLPGRTRRFGATVVVVERRSFRDALEPLSEVAAFAAGQPLVADVVLEVLANVGREAARAGHEDRVQAVVELALRVFEPLVADAPTAQARDELADLLAPITALTR